MRDGNFNFNWMEQGRAAMENSAGRESGRRTAGGCGKNPRMRFHIARNRMPDALPMGGGKSAVPAFRPKAAVSASHIR